MSPRDLSQLPLSAWGRHELEAEIQSMQACIDALLKRVRGLEASGGPCEICAGTGRHRTLGTCQLCGGTGSRKKLVEGLIELSVRLEKEIKEAKQQADECRKRLEGLQAWFEDEKALELPSRSANAGAKCD